MDILVLSDKPDSKVLEQGGIDSSNAIPFSHPPFDPKYMEPNTDVPESVKLLKDRLMRCDSVVVHILPGQRLSSLIAWGKLHGSSWTHLDSATVIREDGDSHCEDEMNGRLAEVLDECLDEENDGEIELDGETERLILRSDAQHGLLGL